MGHPVLLGTLAVLGSALAAPGCGEETCTPRCGTGFACFYGVCVPGPADAGDVGREDVGTDEGGGDVLPDGDDDGDTIPNATDNCPSEANPDQGNCDGDTLGDVCDGDDDGDTIPDSLDLCSCTTPVGTHDEDGDTLVDECDNCPEVSNIGQLDGDGDRIGDSCEYQLDPARVSARIGFVTFVESPLWRAESGDWWRRDDMFGQDQNFGGAVAFDPAWGGGNDMMIRTVASWGTSADAVSRLAGVLMRVASTTSPAQWYYCCVNEVDDTVQIWSYAGTFDLIVQEPLSIAISPGTFYRIVGTAFGSELSCVVETDGGTAGMAAAGAGAGLTGGIGLRTYGTQATFTSVTVYR